MRRLLSLVGIGAVSVVLLAVGGGVAQAAPTGSYVLTAASTAGSYAPTFTGNGLLGVRVPPSGQGYAPGTVPAQSELAGFYAQPPGDVQQRANIPTWSTLAFSDGGEQFSASSAGTTGWRQSIDLHTGVVTTTARWKASNGHTTLLTYQVLTDRARPNIGIVTLQMTPLWSGTATVTDAIDGTPANLSTEVTKGWSPDAPQDWVEVQARGDRDPGGDRQPAAHQRKHRRHAHARRSVDGAERRPAVVVPGHGRPDLPDHQVRRRRLLPDRTRSGGGRAGRGGKAARAGLVSLRRASDAAWAALWNGRIDVVGNNSLATDVNASEFYLWSSTRAGVDWSVSPAGLSSNGYDGHIFWDAETWMYPSLLAQHPDVAAGMNNYRFDRLTAAEQHAAATGYQGARFPWESALDGTEQIPPPVSVNSEGLFEQHITADIAEAQWQYYLATGDKKWLATRGWPVISEAATFWASRATLGSDGHYHLLGITGPDEENPDVNDEVYTNVAARATLQDAIQAARALGRAAPANWSQIASGLIVLSGGSPEIHPEFSGYGGQLVKQADVTLLQYPWAFPMSPLVAQNDLDYYTVRSDPDGPSMTDAIGTIDSAALGTPGCSSYVYTQRSLEPFIRDVFDQFSETRNGGAFTFMTGIGGFLQEFLYGYSGMRWNGSAVQLSPSLTSQIGGLVLNDLNWRGRSFTVSIGPRKTTVVLNHGPAMPVNARGHKRRLRAGHALTINTRRPDLTKTSDVVRCGAASASSSQPGAPPLAAVDGSPATDWQPMSLPATLTLPVKGKARSVHTATLTWGEKFPGAPGPNIPPPPGPVTILRATSYEIQVSTDGRSWRTVATVSGRTDGTVDTVTFASTRARFIRAQLTASGSGYDQPMLEELTAG